MQQTQQQHTRPRSRALEGSEEMCLCSILALRAECDGAIQVIISTGIVARSQSTFTETKQDVLLGFAQLSTLDLQTIQRSERLSIVLIRQEILFMSWRI